MARFIAGCVSLLCAIAMSARGDTITVVNTNDSGPGSLRQAIADANNGDMIDFDPPLKGQTITLISGELAIESGARTPRTPQHFVRNGRQGLPCFAKLSECARVLAPLSE